MNIDNSGSSLVIDPKSQAAIDAVRDRITLLESENARLTRLKAVLDDSVRKAEADLAYKIDLLTDIDAQIEIATIKLNETIATEVEANNSVAEITERITFAEKEIDERSSELVEREKKLNAREFAVDARTEILLDGETDLAIANALMQVKKDAIEELLTKL